MANQPNSSPVLYAPSSAEKKKAVLMYLFLGIMVSLQTPEMSVFEYFHLRQALGWWLVFVCYLVPCLLLLMIPWIGVVAWFFMIVLLIMGGLFAKQAWDGKYKETVDETLLPIFVWLGSWVLNIFDIRVSISGTIKE
jgi:hypothetical protein